MLPLHTSEATAEGNAGSLIAKTIYLCATKPTKKYVFLRIDSQSRNPHFYRIKYQNKIAAKAAAGIRIPNAGFFFYLCDMDNALLSHIARFITLDDTETDLLLSHLDYRTAKKKTHLLEAGQLCHEQYFIVKGCCRSYIINEKGGEQTTQFAIENWWVTDYLGFDSGRPSDFYVQAIENTEAIAISKQNMEMLLIKIPKLERYFRIIMQKAFGASQVRIKYLFTMSAEERYNHLNNLFPEFVRRVPQYMLATYLDFSPEFMSKIRAGKI